MRTNPGLIFLLLGCLGCAATGNPVQAPQDPDLLARLRAAAPGAQRPPSESRVAAAAVRVEGAVGTVATRVSGTRFDDRATAGRGRLELDSSAAEGRGASLQASFFGTDYDLFAYQLMSNGQEPVRADAALQGLSLFPHARWVLVDEGGVALSLRAGLQAEAFRYAHGIGPTQRQWWSVGPRFLFEPVYRVLQDRDRTVEFYAQLGADAGFAEFRERYRGGSDEDFCWRLGASAGLGLRYRLGAWRGELGYEGNYAGFSSTDTDLLGEGRRAGFVQHWLLLGIALEF